MTDQPFPNDRLLELLADREVGSLDAESRRELDAMLAECPEADDGSMEAAAVALMLGSLGEIEEMPAEVRSGVLGSLTTEGTTEGTTGGPTEARTREVRGPGLRLTVAPDPVVKASRSLLAWSGWFAAAACLVIAATVVFNRPGARPAVDPASARAQFLQTAADVKHAEWGDWDSPEQPGVKGVVDWSEAEQRGYMTFEGLAVNNPTEEQYQLWIIDERGMEQRISGAIFNADSTTGEVVVEIDPAIEVHGAAAFAITIERPGGTWVSDMSRRVVIAALNG